MQKKVSLIYKVSFSQLWFPYFFVNKKQLYFSGKKAFFFKGRNVILFFFKGEMQFSFFRTWSTDKERKSLPPAPTFHKDDDVDDDDVGVKMKIMMIIMMMKMKIKIIIIICGSVHIHILKPYTFKSEFRTIVRSLVFFYICNAIEMKWESILEETLRFLFLLLKLFIFLLFGFIRKCKSSLHKVWDILSAGVWEDRDKLPKQKVKIFGKLRNMLNVKSLTVGIRNKH